MGAHIEQLVFYVIYLSTLFLVRTNLQLPASGPLLDCVQNVNIIVQHAHMQRKVKRTRNRSGEKTCRN